MDYDLFQTSCSAIFDFRLFFFNFLADCTNGHAYATVLLPSLSVVCLSVCLSVT